MTGCPTASPGRPFGRVLTAMVTPFDAHGAVDLDKAQQLAKYLVELGNDGLVINGTTGESPTTNEAEKADLIRAVVEAVGDRATVVSGAGSYDTAHSVRAAQQAEAAGAHGLLVVTPYYSRPTQRGLVAHFSAVADAVGVPVMLYDIPPRTIVPIEVATLQELAAHPRIVAVKDAKGDLLAGQRVMATTDLAYYSGDDPLNLPWLSVGAVGVVSVIGHLAADRIRSMIDAFEAGDVVGARAISHGLLPLLQPFTRMPGVTYAKAGLRLRGVDVGEPRLPLVPSTPDEIGSISADLAAAAISLGVSA
ncbi:4-hydroxy-tetrahydrodipicolinate synthase [Umezawaea tangerina]|uniref:4-hydroxy-tetrahydrodipicolinate synthase n=1 Tax=Umezawaea tangerina TaxID=84725 RepID=A0A2T0TA61_9PSEU|nr:4-hydroxy-tetrahydrodipicolinate synthase [Umezawaea tangerina]PRY42528.1 4-hydroxy-tetrahydrodipicolinate synthase [Umezawaea tangerina]